MQTRFSLLLWRKMLLCVDKVQPSCQNFLYVGQEWIFCRRVTSLFDVRYNIDSGKNSDMGFRIGIAAG